MLSKVYFHYFNYVCVFAYMRVPAEAGDTLISLDLVLQVAVSCHMCVLGTRLRPSARGVRL